MKKYIVYISGPMSGIPEYNHPLFFYMEQEIKNKGHRAWNPARVTFSKKKTPCWADYMRKDIRGLMQCNSILMLPEWEKSKGANLEHKIAKTLNLTIFYNIREIESISSYDESSART